MLWHRHFQLCPTAAPCASGTSALWLTSGLASSLQRSFVTAHLKLKLLRLSLSSPLWTEEGSLAGPNFSSTFWFYRADAKLVFRKLLFLTHCQNKHTPNCQNMWNTFMKLHSELTQDLLLLYPLKARGYPNPNTGPFRTAYLRNFGSPISNNQ